MALSVRPALRGLPRTAAARPGGGGPDTGNEPVRRREAGGGFSTGIRAKLFHSHTLVRFRFPEHARVIDLPAGHERRRFGDGDGWRARPEALGIAGMTVSPDPVRIATEGALWGTIRDAGRIAGTVIPVDDAGQFNVGDLHALCWFHAERNIAKLNGSAPCQHERVDKVLDRVWRLYRSLCRYRKRPTPLRKLVMQRRFDRIFGTAAGCASLRPAARKAGGEPGRAPARARTVRRRRSTPTGSRTTSGTTSRRRKVSFGTRSDAGRTARDACIGAKKTCRKLGVPCRDCLRNRLGVFRRSRSAEACRPSQAARRGLTRPLGPGGNSRKVAPIYKRRRVPLCQRNTGCP